MPIEPDSIGGIKKTLQALDADELRILILRTAKYKKENKELLSYLLYQEQDLEQFVKDVKFEVDSAFANIQMRTAYLAAKGLRKALKQMNKYIRFCGNKEAEAELVLYFCNAMLVQVPQLKSSSVLTNLYERQIERALRAISTLHPEKQADFNFIINRHNMD